MGGRGASFLPVSSKFETHPSGPLWCIWTQFRLNYLPLYPAQNRWHYSAESRKKENLSIKYKGSFSTQCHSLRLSIERKDIFFRSSCKEGMLLRNQVKRKICCIEAAHFWMDINWHRSSVYHKIAPVAQISYSLNLNAMASVLKWWWWCWLQWEVQNANFSLSVQLCATTAWEGVGTSLVRCTRETGLANFRYTQCFRYSCGLLWGFVQKKSPGLVFCHPPHLWEIYPSKEIPFPNWPNLETFFCTLPSIFLTLCRQTFFYVLCSNCP